MESFTDIASLKTIPGFQSIMKVIVKNLIQTLVDQLTTHTDEECVILTASVQDATLSQFSSQSGQIFLQENEEITSKFVGFCEKRFYHRNSVDQSSRRTNYSPEGEPVAVSQNPTGRVEQKGKFTRKRKPKEKSVEKKKCKTIATENLYKRKKLLESTNISTTPEPIFSEQNTCTAVGNECDTIKEELQETNNYEYTIDQGLANIVQSTEGVPPIDISNLKLETVDDIVEIQLAVHCNNDGAADTTSIEQPNEGVQDSVHADNVSHTVASSSTTSKKKKSKSRAEIQRAYRERLKAKDRDAFYAKERERQRGYYTPSHRLPPRMREEWLRKRREYIRQYRQRKKTGFVSMRLVNSKV